MYNMQVAGVFLFPLSVARDQPDQWKAFFLNLPKPAHLGRLRAPFLEDQALPELPSELPEEASASIFWGSVGSRPGLAGLEVRWGRAGGRLGTIRGARLVSRYNEALDAPLG